MTLEEKLKQFVKNLKQKNDIDLNNAKTRFDAKYEVLTELEALLDRDEFERQAKNG